MSDELRNCPFCGGEATTHEEGFSACSQCNARGPEGRERGHVVAAELWNRRPEPSADLREGLEGVLCGVYNAGARSGDVREPPVADTMDQSVRRILAIVGERPTLRDDAALREGLWRLYKRAYRSGDPEPCIHQMVDAIVRVVQDCPSPKPAVCDPTLRDDAWLRDVIDRVLDKVWASGYEWVGKRSAWNDDIMAAVREWSG